MSLHSLMLPGVDSVGQSAIPGPQVGLRYPAGMVVVGMVVVGIVVVLGFVRRHTFLFLVTVQVKRPAVVVRTLPTLLQVVPATLGAATFGAIAAAGAATTVGASLCSGVAIGRMPVSAAAPTLMVWHTMHMGALDDNQARRKGRP